MKAGIKRTVLTILTAVLMIFAMMPMTSSATDDSYSNNSGVGAEGNANQYIKWTLYRDGTLYLYPDQYVGEFELNKGDDTWAGEIAYYGEPSGDYSPPPTLETGKDKVKYLVVADRITNIAADMFTSYPDLESVTLPDGIEIDANAFFSCTNLKTVTVNGSVRSIRKQAFCRCKTLKTFTIEGTVGSVGESAFSMLDTEQNTCLAGFDAPVTGDIGIAAFRNCAALKSISPIRGNVGARAFKGTAVDKVYLVYGHTGILGDEGGDSAFESGVTLGFTGSEENFRYIKDYNGKHYYYGFMHQSIGDNVRWYKDENGVVTITGSGRTIDLLDTWERPWGDDFTKIIIDRDIQCGSLMLDGLDRWIRYGSFVTVDGGLGSGFYEENGTVTITADAAPEGQRFKKWMGADDLEFISGSASTPTATFRMPDRDVTVEAIFEEFPSHTVTVTNGTGSETYKEGSAVTITADAAPEGQRFKKWMGADDLTFTSGNASTPMATFTMPAGDVMLTATYEASDSPDIPRCRVYLQSGSGSGADVTLFSLEPGRYYGYSGDGAGAQKGQFYHDGTDLWFRAPDCPGSFAGPDETVFVGWSTDGGGRVTLSPGNVCRATDGLILTACWVQTGNAELLSLTVDNGVLDPQFSPDIYRYNVILHYNGSSAVVRAIAERADSTAVVKYDKWDTCPAIGDGDSITIEVFNGANKKTYKVFVYVYYSVSAEIEGNGTVKIYDRSGKVEDTDFINESECKLVATPAEGWQLKEWKLISGNGTLSSIQYDPQSAYYRIGTDNAVIKAIFEEIPAPPQEPVSIEDAEVVLSKTAFTYNGAVQKPEIKTIGGKTLTEDTDYEAEWSDESSKNAGTYTVTITGKGDYTGTAKATYTINKAANPLSVTARTATLKAKKLKKKTQKLAAAKVMNVSRSQGAVSYKLAGVSKAKFRKYFKVDARTGNVTVKKKLKKGKYKLTISVTAAGSGNYNAATKTVTATIKVK